MQFEMLPDWFIMSALGVFGALVGSFLNVCIYRLPAGESVVTPSSHCPRCRTVLKPIDLLPVFSWLALGRRCRYCGITISSQYALIELITALSFVFTWHHFGFGLHFFIAICIICSLLVASIIDIRYQIIPDEITIPGIVLGAAFHGILKITISEAELMRQGYHMTLTDSFVGILAGGGLLYALAWLSFGGMGGGDVKLMAMIGALLGPAATLMAILIASFIGAGFGIMMIVTGFKGRKDYIPFGPYLAVGTLIVLFFGTNGILNWYLGLLS